VRGEGSLGFSDFIRVLGGVEGRARAEDRAALRRRSALDTACAREWRVGTRKESSMLRIYPVILAFVEEVAPLIGRIARHDPDLARQLRRASASVALNTAEGMYARGRQRAACYNVALREMSESHAALEVAVRLRYVAPLPEALERRVAHIIGTLVRLSFPRQGAG